MAILTLVEFDENLAWLVGMLPPDADLLRMDAQSRADEIRQHDSELREKLHNAYAECEKWRGLAVRAEEARVMAYRQALDEARQRLSLLPR